MILATKRLWWLDDAGGNDGYGMWYPDGRRFPKPISYTVFDVYGTRWLA